MNARAIWFCFGGEGDAAGRKTTGGPTDRLTFCENLGSWLQVYVPAYKRHGRELRREIRDLRLAVYVILRGWGGVYVFIGATASARGLKGLEVHWRWIYSCCNPSTLGVP
jgi:hypothetical protein